MLATAISLFLTLVCKFIELILVISSVDSFNLIIIPTNLMLTQIFYMFIVVCMKFTILAENLDKYSTQLCLVLYLPLDSHLALYCNSELSYYIIYLFNHNMLVAQNRV